MTDHDEPVAGGRVGQIGDVVEVVEEVVVAPRPDPLAVAVPAQVGGDHVEAGRGQGGRDRREAPREIEEAVEAEEGGSPAAVPLEQVVAEAVRDQVPLRRMGIDHGRGA